MITEVGCLRACQPPNSPHANTKDMCVFPALSKRASAEQGLASKGSNALKEGDELWNIVQKTWNEYSLDAIARSHAVHHQAAAAVHSCNVVEMNLLVGASIVTLERAACHALKMVLNHQVAFL